MSIFEGLGLGEFGLEGFGLESLGNSWLAIAALLFFLPKLVGLALAGLLLFAERIPGFDQLWGGRAKALKCQFDQKLKGNFQRVSQPLAKLLRR